MLLLVVGQTQSQMQPPFAVIVMLLLIVFFPSSSSSAGPLDAKEGGHIFMIRPKIERLLLLSAARHCTSERRAHEEWSSPGQWHQSDHHHNHQQRQLAALNKHKL